MRCIATNCGGSNTTTSNAATLTPAFPVNITFITESGVKCTGETDTLIVSATGNALAYQWSMNGTTINGATNSVLILNPVTKEDSASFTCYVSNICKDSIATTYLTVNSPPQIIDTIATQDICLNDTISFTVKATGTNINYQWTKEGNDITGATNLTYTVNKAQFEDYDVYSCIVSNSCGSSNLNPFILNVNSPPILNTPCIRQTQYVADSVTYSFSLWNSAIFLPVVS